VRLPELMLSWLLLLLLLLAQFNLFYKRPLSQIVSPQE